MKGCRDARAACNCAGLMILLSSGGFGSTAWAIETIVCEDCPEVVPAGEAFSVLFRLTNNTIPLVGYTLNVDIGPEPGAVGTVLGNVGLSNLFEEDNLIEQDPGGGSLHPLFSLIGDPGDGGVFVTAIEEDGNLVAPAGPEHDVLAQVWFDASPDAWGFFTISLGPGSVLSHQPLFDVPFEGGPWTFFVPEPAGLILLSALVVGNGWRRRRPLGASRT